LTSEIKGEYTGISAGLADNLVTKTSECLPRWRDNHNALVVSTVVEFVAMRAAENRWDRVAGTGRFKLFLGQLHAELGERERKSG
jgi:hypothetical protein